MNLLLSSSLVLTPNAYKEGVLFGIVPTNPASSNGDFTVTRATTATRTNSAGLVELVPYNLLTYSEQFDNGVWVKANTTVTANAILAPNGTLTADKIIATAVTSNHFITLTSVVQTGQFTFSVFAKSSEYSTLILQDFYSGLYNCQYNLSLGTATGTGASIENMGDGWYKCIVTYTSNGYTVANGFIGSPTTITTYTGDGTSGIFVWGAQLVEGTQPLTYLPTTTRLNIPRVDYSLGSANLLLEPQRTNLLVSSSQFDGASWSKQNASVTANSTISPSGITDADTLLANGASGIHRTFQLVTFVSGTSYTISVYAKKNTNDFFQIVLSDSVFNSSAGWANFDLNNGTIGTKGDQTNANITDVGNGWYRCSLTATAVASISETVTIVLISSSTAARQEVNTLSTSVYLWGAQLEAGAYATSYIPTTTASVTRNADVVSKTGISSLIGSSEYTLFWDGKHIPTGVFNSFFTCYQESNLVNSVRFYRVNSNNGIRAALFNTSSGLSITLNSGITTENAKCALRVKAGDYALFVNGSLVDSSASALAPSNSLDALNIQYFDASQSFQQELKGLAFWKTALTNTQLAQLTTL